MYCIAKPLYNCSKIFNPNNLGRCTIALYVYYMCCSVWLHLSVDLFIIVFPFVIFTFYCSIGNCLVLILISYKGCQATLDFWVLVSWFHFRKFVDFFRNIIVYNTMLTFTTSINKICYFSCLQEPSVVPITLVSKTTQPEDMV